jgi:hypothetical protein
MGADQVIDYNKEDFTKVLSNIDAVFDTVGGSVAERSFTVLKPGGRAAFIASGPTAPKPSRDDVRSLRPNVKRDRQHLERILSLWNEGAVRVPEIKLFKLAEAPAAHELSEGRAQRGAPSARQACVHGAVRYRMGRWAVSGPQYNAVGGSGDLAPPANRRPEACSAPTPSIIGQTASATRQ